jgi:dipeptidyl aminopeptidase/acylaminoacyl peptidase
MVQPVFRRARACALVFVAFVTLLGASPTQAARPIAETDLFDFVWIADPQISPDGSRVVFVRVTVNDKKDGYDTSLWVVETSGASAPRRLTSGTRDTAPRWSPDGAWLAFVRPVDARGRTSPQIHLLSMAGGEATAITDLPRGAGAAVWAPDGKTIAFLSTTKPDDLTEKKDPAERVSDVRVITRAVYRGNGGGYRDADQQDLDGAGEAPAVKGHLTSGDFGESGLTWTRDSQRILFTTTLDKEPYYKPQDSDLFAIPAGGGTPALVASIDGGIGNVVVSPEGGRVAFVASPSTPVRWRNPIWVTPRQVAPNLTTASTSTGTDAPAIRGSRGGRAAAPTGRRTAAPSTAPT